MQHYERYRQDRQLEQYERRDRWHMASDVAEFVGVVLGVVVILGLLALLFSLVSWLNQDIRSTFALLSDQI